MKKFLLLILVIFSQISFANETLVIIRHGEKPENGLGQLTCQGLNRSLKLANVLEGKFGVPDKIYAPNPSELKNDKGNLYNYIRPLATIEPTAIKFSMPVILKYNFKDIDVFSEELLNEENSNRTIFIAWEHHLGAKLVEKIMNKINKTEDEYHWADDDFDSIYVVKINKENGELKSLFYKEQQNLNNLSKVCGE
jgi:hypothetical protein